MGWNTGPLQYLSIYFWPRSETNVCHGYYSYYSIDPMYYCLCFGLVVCAMISYPFFPFHILAHRGALMGLTVYFSHRNKRVQKPQWIHYLTDIWFVYFCCTKAPCSKRKNPNKALPTVRSAVRPPIQSPIITNVSMVHVD